MLNGHTLCVCVWGGGGGGVVGGGVVCTQQYCLSARPFHKFALKTLYDLLSPLPRQVGSHSHSPTMLAFYNCAPLTIDIIHGVLYLCTHQ